MQPPRKGRPPRREPTPPPPEDDPAAAHPDDQPASGVLSLSTLQLFDLLAAPESRSGPLRHEWALLRQRIADLEEQHEQAAEAVEQLSAAVDRLKSPALRVGLIHRLLHGGTALVSVAGTDYVCRLDPDTLDTPPEPGTRVLLNEAFAIVETLGPDPSGPVARIAEALADGRLRLGGEGSATDLLVARGPALAKEKLRPGLEVRLDPQSRVALEVVGSGRRLSRHATAVDPLPWSAIGGQDEAVQAIRDTIELPLLHAHLFARFHQPVPKGFLLHGPPGCGKTLLGRATAHNLRVRLREQHGADRPEFFLSIKGPEILNMWLGESERHVRDLFAQCRERAAEGHLAFLFIDEAESILGTRHAARIGSSILSTLVPMFCTEMDGLEPRHGVVVILASNRPDLIDPAILRPGRIDRKIRVRRPDAAAAREIYGLYLSADLPLSEPREALIDAVVARHFAPIPENRFLELTHRSGRREWLHRGDLASGAIIAAVVGRAKQAAIKRSIAEGGALPSPISRDDLAAALDHEYAENELFPPTDVTEDWLKLTDLDPSQVIRLSPVRRASPPPHQVV